MSGVPACTRTAPPRKHSNEDKNLIKTQLETGCWGSERELPSRHLLPSSKIKRGNIIWGRTLYSCGRCPGQQRHMRIYLFLQELAKHNPSLIYKPAPARASPLPAGSEPQAGRLSVTTAPPQPSISSSPKALHPSPPCYPQPMPQPELHHSCSAGVLWLLPSPCG